MSWKNILRKGDAWEMSQMGYDPEDSYWYGDRYTETDRLLQEQERTGTKRYSLAIYPYLGIKGSNVEPMDMEALNADELDSDTNGNENSSNSKYHKDFGFWQPAYEWAEEEWKKYNSDEGWLTEKFKKYIAVGGFNLPDEEEAIKSLIAGGTYYVLSMYEKHVGYSADGRLGKLEYMTSNHGK